MWLYWQFHQAVADQWMSEMLHFSGMSPALYVFGLALLVVWTCQTSKSFPEGNELIGHGNKGVFRACKTTSRVTYYIKACNDYLDSKPINGWSIWGLIKWHLWCLLPRFWAEFQGKQWQPLMSNWPFLFVLLSIFASDVFPNGSKQRCSAFWTSVQSFSTSAWVAV